jgi:DNA repair photolyase
MIKKTVFVPYSPKQVVNKHKHLDHWFWVRYTVHPYIGCQHGCEFCYCRENKYAPYADLSDFPHVIKVKENAPDLLRRALAKAPKDTVFLGDYQPAEKKFLLSRKMLEICLDLDFPVFILERSPLVLRDLDLLQEINRKTHATVAFSVIHTSKSPHATEISRLENLAPPHEKRFEAMQTLSKAGIRTGICFMPILPGLCDNPENLELVIKSAADNGGRFVLASTLTLADQQKTYFLEVLRSCFPELYDRYQSLYPTGSYGPAGDTWLKVGRQIREICRQAGIPDRQPRPLISGEKRSLNKRVAEFLADKTYSMELESESASRIWPYRKAAWAVEELEQDLGLVYRKMGLVGLKSINNIGESIGLQIESFIQSDQKKPVEQ